jgi:hypothetical protein
MPLWGWILVGAAIWIAVAVVVGLTVTAILGQIGRAVTAQQDEIFEAELWATRAPSRGAEDAEPVAEDAPAPRRIVDHVNHASDRVRSLASASLHVRPSKSRER